MDNGTAGAVNLPCYNCSAHMDGSAHYNPHPPQLTTQQRAAFRRRIRRFYAKHGRTLPWRPPRLRPRTDGTLDPYRIAVSEVMLQQTQVPRVISAYRDFLRRFPNIRSLAAAELADVLTAWSGLGYNRRAKMLWRMARVVRDEYNGIFPRDEAELRQLPGIGPYTASAICVFAFNTPCVLLETNIRTVFIHEFFPDAKQVHDDSITPLIQETIDRSNPREWYAALMDYGSHLKRTYGNAGAQSAHHVRQAPFSGSSRQLRGAIVRTLTQKKSGATAKTLARQTNRELAETHTQLEALIREGICKKRGNLYVLNPGS